VAGSRDSETRALMVAVLGMILNVHDCFWRGLLDFPCLRKRGRERRIGNKRTDLLVLELYQIRVVDYDLILFIFACFEELGQSKPLTSHLLIS
jgi:hypothetical protein